VEAGWLPEQFQSEQGRTGRRYRYFAVRQCPKNQSRLAQAGRPASRRPPVKVDPWNLARFSLRIWPHIGSSSRQRLCDSVAEQRAPNRTLVPRIDSDSGFGVIEPMPSEHPQLAEVFIVAARPVKPGSEAGAPKV
jgi:hypothetical protein